MQMLVQLAAEHRWAATRHAWVLSNEGQLFRREEPLSWGGWDVSYSSK